MTEIEVRSPKSEVRSPGSEVRGPETGDRRPESEVITYDTGNFGLLKDRSVALGLNLLAI